eukprot:scaffold2267_cov112-Isochrysis_galbana.AAC.3
MSSRPLGGLRTMSHLSHYRLLGLGTEAPQVELVGRGWGAGAAAGAGGSTGVVVIGDDGCAKSANAKCVGTGDSAGDSVGPLVAAPVKAVEVDEIKAARRVMEEGSSFPRQTAWRDRVGSKDWGTTAKAWGGGVRRQARRPRRR